MTDDLTADLLGRKPDRNGITLVGSNTEPPYAGVLLEANALDGQPIFFALLKGKFRLDEQNLATNEDELSEPEADELEGQFIADANGNTYATARGEDKRKHIEALFDNITGEKQEEDEEEDMSSGLGEDSGSEDLSSGLGMA